MITQVFTFGSGQTCPYTGQDLYGHYATVVAADKADCLALMIAMFGGRWAFQYDSVEAASPPGYGPLVEHMRLTLGQPTPPEPPNPRRVRCEHGTVWEWRNGGYWRPGAPNPAYRSLRDLEALHGTVTPLPDMPPIEHRPECPGCGRLHFPWCPPYGGPGYTQAAIAADDSKDPQ